MGVCIEVLSGPARGRRFEITEHETFLIGRARDCHCAVSDDRYMSRHHVVLEVNPPLCLLRDLGSRNGIVINGRRYRSEELADPADQSTSGPVRFLKHGDKVTVGRTCIRVTVSEPAVCAECFRSVPPSDHAEGSWFEDGFLCHACRSALRADPAAEARKPQPIKPVRIPSAFRGRDEESVETDAGGRSTEPEGSWGTEEQVARGLILFPGYEVICVLGGHQLSKVFLAHETATGRRVAIKALRPTITDPTGKTVERFVREMEVCMDLDHPNIVRFERMVREEHQLHFVMEYCEAGSVRDYADRLGRNLSLDEAERIILPVLSALEYAHGKHIVHRDLKPSNILLVKHGSELVARVSDFGLAKNFQMAGLSGITLSGTFSGTYPYMPPEQLVHFREAEPTVDLFSVGATLYNLLTGAYVYDFRDGEDYVNALLECRIVPVRMRDPDFPPRLAEVIDRSISIDPGRRYGSARELRDAFLSARS